MTSAFRGLDHVGVVVRDLDASIDWYKHHLGLNLVTRYDLPGARVAFVGRGDLRLELFQTEGASPMSADREGGATNLKIGGINHFAIAVNDIDAVLSELARNGVEIESPPREVPDGRGDRFAFIHDNERMLIELFQPGAQSA